MRSGKRNFSDFYHSLQYSLPVSGIAELEQMKEFDVFCVGSDQVWNPRITDGLDDVFTLNGNLSNKVSYASSMGSLQFGGYDAETLLRRLSTFDSISVREKGAYEYLRNNLPQAKVKKVVDPTILYGLENWEESLRQASIQNLLPEKYVLIYALGGCFDAANIIAHNIAKKIGVKVAAITLSSRPKKVDYLMNNISPLQFVDLIKNASFVVTNSFHGTCFSLIYGKPFYSVRYDDNPARAEELLEKYSLSDRLYRKDTVIKDAAFDNTDVCQAQIKLQTDASDSEKWLGGAING